MLKARTRKMDNKMNKGRKKMEARHLDLFAQVSLEWEEQQISQSLMKYGGEINIKEDVGDTNIPYPNVHCVNY